MAPSAPLGGHADQPPLDAGEAGDSDGGDSTGASGAGSRSRVDPTIAKLPTPPSTPVSAHPTISTCPPVTTRSASRNEVMFGGWGTSGAAVHVSPSRDVHRAILFPSVDRARNPSPDATTR